MIFVLYKKLRGVDTQLYNAVCDAIDAGIMRSAMVAGEANWQYRRKCIIKELSAKGIRGSYLGDRISQDLCIYVSDELATMAHLRYSEE